MIINIPGNLLILGEYVVTVKGGLGVAIAIDERVFIKTEPGDTLTVTGVFAGKNYRWQETFPSSPDTRLIETVWRETSIHLAGKNIPLRIDVDSSRFYYPDGRKKGFGSSAAVCAGLVYAFLRDALKREPDLAGEVFPLALKAHRAFQRGRGSGYDVAASIFGGAGILTGGKCPRWRGINLPEEEPFYLVKGDKAVSTVDAIEAFTRWRNTEPENFEKFCAMSNRRISVFGKSPSRDDLRRAFRGCRWLGKWIGKKINFPAEGPCLRERLKRYAKEGCLVKALGAGSEIGIVWGPAAGGGRFLEEISIAGKGLTCIQ